MNPSRYVESESGFLIERKGHRFELWFLGMRLDDFRTKAQARHVMYALVPHEDKIAMLAEIEKHDYRGPERKPLIVEINALHLEARRTMP